jgi:hypothetical protein
LDPHPAQRTAAFTSASGILSRLGAEEVAFEPSVFLLNKTKAQQLKAHPAGPQSAAPGPPQPTGLVAKAFHDQTSARSKASMVQQSVSSNHETAICSSTFLPESESAHTS